MKNGVESLGRIRAQGITLLLLTFAAGLLLGFAGERFRTARAATPPPDPGLARFQPPREGELPPVFRQLNLEPEQRRQISGIMREARPRTDVVLGELLPRLRAVTDSINEEIRNTLTDEQIAVWDSLVVDMRSRHGMMRGGVRGRRGARGPAVPPEAIWGEGR